MRGLNQSKMVLNLSMKDQDRCKRVMDLSMKDQDRCKRVMDLSMKDQDRCKRELDKKKQIKAPNTPALSPLLDIDNHLIY